MLKFSLIFIVALTASSSLYADTYVVNYWEDEVDFNVGDGICDVNPGTPLQCTLRAAVQEAEFSSDPDRVEVPPPPAGEAYTMDLLRILGGGPLGLGKDTWVVGTGDQPVEIRGSGEGGGFAVFLIDGVTAVPVVENLLIRCGVQGFFYHGVDGHGQGRLKNSTVTGCGFGITGPAGNNPFLLDRVLVEGNDLGVVHFGGNLQIKNSTIRGNFEGGILAEPGIRFQEPKAQGVPGTVLWIENSLIAYNEAPKGGGLFLSGLTHTVIVNSTISWNRATDDGGGIYVALGAELELANTTIAFNVADSDNDVDGDGGGVWFSTKALVTLRNTIVTNNVASGLLVETWGCWSTGNAILSQGYNLVHRSAACQGVVGDPTNIVEQSANLEQLADNGGPTHTHALQPLSPVIDRGNPSGCVVDGDFNNGTPLVPLNFDQRGADRHIDGDDDQEIRCDIGAFEDGGLPMGLVFADGFESGDFSAWSSSEV